MIWLLRTCRSVLGPLGIAGVLGIAHKLSNLALYLVAGIALGQGAQAWLSGGQPPSLWPVAAWLAGLSLLKGALRYGEQYFGHKVAFKALALLRNKLYAALAPQAPFNARTRASGDMLTRATRDIDRVEVFFAHTIPPLVAALVVPVIVVVSVGNLRRSGARRDPCRGVAAHRPGRAAAGAADHARRGAGGDGHPRPHCPARERIRAGRRDHRRVRPRTGAGGRTGGAGCRAGCGAGPRGRGRILAGGPEGRPAVGNHRAVVPGRAGAGGRRDAGPGRSSCACCSSPFRRSGRCSRSTVLSPGCRIPSPPPSGCMRWCTGPRRWRTRSIPWRLPDGPLGLEVRDAGLVAGGGIRPGGRARFAGPVGSRRRVAGRGGRIGLGQVDACRPAGARPGPGNRSRFPGAAQRATTRR